jgi:lysophospholipase
LGAFTVRGIQAPDKVPLRACMWEPDEGVARRGVCVLLNGLTEFVEKYQEVASELNARGFTVVSLDWRGQGGSERMAPGNRKIHVRDFDEYDLDLITLMREFVPPQTEGPIIALAHSLGGHVLLRHLKENRRRFASAVLIAPMLGVNTQPYSLWLTKAVTAFFNVRGPSKRFVFGVADRDPMTLPFEKNVVTSDRGRFERTQALLRAQPYLRTFGPTFGWLGAAFRSIRKTSARGYAEEIVTPILFVSAGEDKVVLTPPEREYAKRLVNGHHVEIAGAAHEILMERDEIRRQFWKAFDEFVDAHAPVIART